jgi:hypothetical protein
MCCCYVVVAIAIIIAIAVVALQCVGGGCGVAKKLFDFFSLFSFTSLIFKYRNKKFFFHQT